MDADALVEQVKALSSGDVSRIVGERMRMFNGLGRRGTDEWFSELCFCILTANSSAKLGVKIQRELGSEGFSTLSKIELMNRLRKMGHRFYSNRAEFICEARRFRNIKNIIKKFSDAKSAREWLVKNVKGIGYKEASHFLRNVGFDDIAILDRHILSVMHEHGMIDRAPKTLTGKKYLEIEGKLAKRLGISLAELDLYLWYLKTGEVLK